MAVPLPPQSSAELDLEKEENHAGDLSTHTSTSSSNHSDEHDLAPNTRPATAKDDIEAYPVGLNVTQMEKNEISRTNTRASKKGLAGVVTRMSTKSSWKDPGPPPDGGLTAWTQVAMGHLVIMNTW